MTDLDLCYTPATELAARIRARKLSPVELMKNALARIEELGGSVERVSLATTDHGVATYYLIAPAECSSNLARFDGIRYGPRFDDARDLLEHYEVTRGEGFGPEVKRRVKCERCSLMNSV